MANKEEDPGASTQQFRAYVDSGSSAAEADGRSRVPVVIAVVIAAIVVVVVGFLVLS